MTKITLIRPDDWHLHLRDGVMLKAVLPETTRDFDRALIMPNLVPPVVSAKMQRTIRGGFWMLYRPGHFLNPR